MFGQCTTELNSANCAGVGGFWASTGRKYWGPVRYLPEERKYDDRDVFYWKFSDGNVFWICRECHLSMSPYLLLRALREGNMEYCIDPIGPYVVSRDW